MTKLFYAAAAATLLLTACKKDDATCSDAWTVQTGSQEADGAGCAAFVGTTAELKGSLDWWWAQYAWKTQPKGTTFKIEATFSRPQEDADRPVELAFRGGFFGVAQDKFFFWDGGVAGSEDPNPHWSGWQATKVDIRQETTLAVRQKGRDLEGFINGQLVGTFKLNTEPTVGLVGVGFKSGKGKAAKVKVHKFALEEI